MKRRPGQLRIIGGQWRSRLIAFEADQGVRPTPDRVRQTLFDWLSPRIEGAVCLDLFAGSGALGLEALSRGATHTHFVEQGRAQSLGIREALHRLDAETRAEVSQSEALRWLDNAAKQAQRYELVFIDPPYAADLLEPVLQRLPPLLKSNNRLYLEWPAGHAPTLPAGYAWLKEKQAGQVSFGLATCTANEPGAPLS
ncbi:16S rRNA (guanine(966)-N(2))-methyltransferase RsmD [Panacagrimonas sp.]|uniref:16S rRNA (guanine(966)-N(2))-methyltransferase RsmD n=1 Tax=Panacagrimonas sp. TaxID=2480088 RepID=UPI003B52C637